MPTLSKSALAKLIGHAVTQRLHEDAKTGLVLCVDDTDTAHLIDGKSHAAGVTATTARRESMHYKSQLVAVPDVMSWLGDATAVDARDMAWSKGGKTFREAVRFGSRVLVVTGGNNARTLMSIGLLFDDQAKAERFFASFTEVPPKGWTRTGPWYVPGRGGVAREYWPAKVPGPKVNKALGQVIDETARWVLDHGNAVATVREETFESAAEAQAAFNAWELEWYRAGGRPYEIEWMKRLRSRSESTLMEYAASRLEKEKDHPAFLRALFTDAEIPSPPKGTKLADVPEAHWLRVGERVSRNTQHIEVKSKPGVTIHFDREHLVVSVITATPGRNTWSVVKRAANEEKAHALWLRTMKRFKCI